MILLKRCLPTKRSWPSALPRLPQGFANLAVVCTRHLQIRMLFRRFGLLSDYTVAHTNQRVAEYHCPVCGHRDLVGKHFTTGKPMTVKTL